MKTNFKSNLTGTSEGGLQELFLEELADIYSAEKTLTKALPKMARAADSDELKDAIRSHLEETENHVSRLEEVFNSLDARVKSKRCEGIEGILEEGEELMEDEEGSSALDAALISAAQKVEHYEIASYGTLVAWAEKMGHGEAATLLRQNLQEEKAADEKLTELAIAFANDKAD
jgi:ferritin-like metal-binding protein YciE